MSYFGVVRGYKPNMDPARSEVDLAGGTEGEPALRPPPGMQAPSMRMEYCISQCEFFNSNGSKLAGAGVCKVLEREAKNGACARRLTLDAWLTGTCPLGKFDGGAE